VSLAPSLGASETWEIEIDLAPRIFFTENSPWYHLRWQ
jgi:hypothetical protein